MTTSEVTSSTESPTIIAVDVGLSGTKCDPDGSAEGLFMFPSRAAPADDVPTKLDGEHENEPLLVGEEEWFAGLPPRSNYPSTLNTEFSISPSYCALVYEALDRAHKPSIDLLVLGLPTALYGTGREEELKKKYRTQHAIRGITYDVRDVLVVNQPIGTVATLTKDGAENVSGDTLVVDPGRWSVDVATITRDWQVDNNLCLSSQQAMGKVCDEMAGLLPVPISADELDTWLGSGKRKITKRGKTVDLESVIHEATSLVARRLIAEIKSKGIQSDDIDRLILTGGGASVFETFFAEAFPDLTPKVVSNPVMCNVIGFRMLGELVLQQASQAA